LGRANNHGELLRRRIDEVFEAGRVPRAAYGTFSTPHIFTNPDRITITPTAFPPDDELFARATQLFIPILLGVARIASGHRVPVVQV
jgi:hypothetical protein